MVTALNIKCFSYADDMKNLLLDDRVGPQNGLDNLNCSVILELLNFKIPRPDSRINKIFYASTSRIYVKRFSTPSDL